MDISNEESDKYKAFLWVSTDSRFQFVRYETIWAQSLYSDYDMS